MMIERSRKMNGVILAAGVGSRLRPLTNDKPKCLIKVNGKSLLDYQLDAYRTAKVHTIYIVVGYEARAIREHCKHIKDLSIKIIENTDYESTNNMYSLYLLKDLIAGKPFILNNADLIIEQNLIKNIVEDSRLDLIAVDTSQFNDESMKVEVSDDGFIIDIAKNITEFRSYGCSIDYYKFSSNASETLFEKVREVVELQNDRNQWTEVALQMLLKSGELKMLPFDIGKMSWVEIDNYEDLQLADYQFSSFKHDFSEIDALFLDLDGTVYLGDTHISRSEEFVEKMRLLGKKVYFLTNNSSKGKEQYVKRLSAHGIEASEEDIILSTDGLIYYMKVNNIRSVYVLGTRALEDRVQNEGFLLTDKNPEYVIIGYDTELTYEKLVVTCNLINSGVDILATHCDITCPTSKGPVPDIGAILEMIRMTTMKEPIKVFGKPQPEMITHIIDKLDVAPDRVAIIGDRLYTDMLLANKVGAQSILVLSGETTRDELDKASYYPSICIPSVAKFLESD